MNNSKTLTLIFAVTLFVVYIGHVEAVMMKLTNLKCKSYNESWVIFKECRLRAIKRDVASCNVRLDLLQSAFIIHINGTIMKRATGGYKPFVMKFYEDACQFMVRHNNPILTHTFNLIKEFSNINHTCPYKGEQIIKDFYPKQENYGIPLPSGDYAGLFTFILHGGKGFSIDFYFTFYDWKN